MRPGVLLFLPGGQKAEGDLTCAGKARDRGVHPERDDRRPPNSAQANARAIRLQAKVLYPFLP
jgi:hypothetical protein